MTPLRLGTRPSTLALVQARLVAARLIEAHPALRVEVIPIAATADLQPHRPLASFSSKAVFTSELDAALLQGRIDVAVHSAKDLETTLAPGTMLGAAPLRDDPRDVLFLDHRDDPRLPARIGTSSLRRAAQLARLDHRLVAMPLRGNVPTRLEKWRRGACEGVVLARAGLHRLEMDLRAGRDLELDEMIPAAGQGTLAVTAREGDEATRQILKRIDVPGVRRCLETERALLRLLGGSCRTPIGVHAEETDGTIRLVAGVFSADGRDAARVEMTTRAEPEAAAREAAGHLRTRGAEAILAGRGVCVEPPGPLAGRRVLVTRAAEAEERLARAVERLGGGAVRLPLLREVALDSRPGIPADELDWIVYTSARAVATADSLEGWDDGLRACARVACVGDATARAAAAHGWRVDLVAEDPSAGALAELMVADGTIRGKRIAVPVSARTGGTLAVRLRAAGAIVDSPVVYTVEPVLPRQEAISEVLAERIDAVLLASGSAVEAWAALGGDHPLAAAAPAVGALGPATAAALERMGRIADFIAPRADFDSLARATAAFLARKE